MRNKVVKKTAVIGVITLALTGMGGIKASAEWKQNEDNHTWNWVENDLKATGWKLINGSWYYFNDDGTMHIGWLKYDNNWYKLDDSGSMLTGWIFDKGKWYYLNNDGTVHVGWLKDNNKWYKLDSNGSMITGWILDNGKWYYAKSSGNLETDSITLDGKTYNFLSDGTMVENTESADFSNDNVLAIDTSIPEKDEDFISNEEVVDTESTVDAEDIEEDNEDIVDMEDTVDTEDNSDKVEEKKEEPKEEAHEVINSKFTERTSEPDLDDKHYYSNDNIFYSVKLSPPFKKNDGSLIKGNCTWYAWGRTWEITGKKPVEAGFTGNAYEWWQANKTNKKYKYGSEPRVGAIAVWSPNLPGSGGCGHVAVVEKIEHGKVYISESMWHGDCFAYKPIYSTQYLYGYIYLDEPIS